jgi:anti-sigma regulatory factor (Ser/Thr protein kinase)
MTAPLERIIRSDVDSLVAATAELEEYLARAAVGTDAAYACTLALEEVVTNVFKYGHSDGGQHEVRFEAEVTAEHAVLRFSDDGRPFDPLAVPLPDLALRPEDRPIGGLGIHLIRTLADRIDYRRTDGRNLLTARFALRPVSRQEPLP